MFTSRTHDRPHATFLLPALPNIFRSRKASEASAASSSAADSTFSTPASSSEADGPPATSARRRRSYRSSVASALSALTTSSGSQPSPPPVPSLSTSPGSFTSASPRSLPASPVAGLAGVGSQPAFATSLTAVPDAADDDLYGVALAPAPRAKPGPLPVTAAAAAASGTGHRKTADRRHSRRHHHHPAAAAAALPGDRRRLERVLPTTLRCRRCAADLAYSAQIVSKGFTGRHGRAYLVSAPATCGDHLYAPEVAARPASPSPAAADRNLANIRVGRAEHRHLVTGAHVVADISCAVCDAKLGWKYVDARDPAQRYKIGKFILEIARLAVFHSWEDAEGEAGSEGEVGTEDDAFCEYDDDDDDDDDDGDGDGSFSDFGSDGGRDPNAVADHVGAARRRMAAARHRARALDGAPAAVEFDSEDDDECEDIFAGTWDAEVVAKRRRAKQAALARRAAA